MKLHTKYFGEIEYLEEDLLHFTAGPFGFEEEREFLLLPFEGSAGTLLCFQSTRTPALAFVAMDPFALLPEYAPVLQPQELEELGVSDSTVNLKCPVAINPDTRAARQVILESDVYEMRHSLAQFSTEEGAPC